MSKVRLVQCLCPLRHCLMAMPYESSRMTDAEAIGLLKGQITILVRCNFINPWCDLCEARLESCRYEVAVTKYHSMDEAIPELKKLQDEQRRDNARIKQQRRTPTQAQLN